MMRLELEMVCAIVAVWSGCEAVFWLIVHFVVLPRLQRLERPPDCPMDSELLMIRCMETIDWLQCNGAACDFNTFVGGWFRGAPIEDVYEGNALDFLSYAMFAEDYAHLPDTRRSKVQRVLAMLESRYSVSFKPGRNASLHCMRTSLEPVRYCHHPLAWYALVLSMQAATALWMRLQGFNWHQSAGGLTYWHRESARVVSNAVAGRAMVGKSRLSGEEEEEELLPLVFCHGIGLGLPIYAYMLKRACQNRTSIVLETPSISMTLHHFWRHRPPAPLEFVDGVRSIMLEHGVARALFVGHSFGTIAVTWMAKHAADLVAQVGLIDPVSLLLFLPDVARNFLYAHDMFDRMTLRQRLFKRIIAQEKGITHTLRRHFWWYHNNMWPEDLRCPAVVALAGKDEISPVHSIRRYVEGWESHSPGHCLGKAAGDIRPVELIWWPQLFHGRSLFKASCIHGFMGAIDAQARQYGLSQQHISPISPHTPTSKPPSALLSSLSSSDDEGASEEVSAAESAEAAVAAAVVAVVAPAEVITECTPMLAMSGVAQGRLACGIGS